MEQKNLKMTRLYFLKFDKNPHTVKMDIISYYLLPNSIVDIFCLSFILDNFYYSFMYILDLIFFFICL